MRKLSIVFLLVLASATAHAEGKKPGKGFWKILVSPKASWVLRDTDDGNSKTARIKVETYDVRKVGKADVARLRWTQIDGSEKFNIGGGPLMPTQVAVTTAGLYLLDDTDDDAKVAAALKAKPSRSDPPKAYQATKRNKGRYLYTSEDSICWGYEPEHLDCHDVCEAEVCISATKGVTRISGAAALNKSSWEQ